MNNGNYLLADVYIFWYSHVKFVFLLDFCSSNNHLPFVCKTIIFSGRSALSWATFTKFDFDLKIHSHASNGIQKLTSLSYSQPRVRPLAKCLLFPFYKCDFMWKQEAQPRPLSYIQAVLVKTKTTIAPQFPVWPRWETLSPKWPCSKRTDWGLCLYEYTP